MLISYILYFIALVLGCFGLKLYLLEFGSIIQGDSQKLSKSICLLLGLYGIMWAKMGGKILLRSGHFDIWFLKFQQIEFCVPYSSVSKWGWILNLHRKCIFIYHYDFIFALISRPFIGLSRYFIWWMEMYQIKRLV